MDAALINGVGFQALPRLERAHVRFDEAFLQRLLEHHPQLLPCKKLRPDVGSLTCIGRGVPVGPSGMIDNLYLSSGGYPVVVETKLWRNPQSRREVLSQVLDYIHDLVTRDFEWLEEAHKRYQHARGVTPPQTLAAIGEEDLGESRFVDRVDRALARGDILALIVGDGIETRLQSLVDHLTRDTPHLRYSLGLVELVCCETGREGELLVMPRLLQHVEPVQRAYVRIELSEALQSTVRVTSNFEPDLDVPSQTATTLTADEFERTLVAAVGAQVAQKTLGFFREVAASFGLELEYTSANLLLLLPETVGAGDATDVLLKLHKSGTIGLFRNFRPEIFAMFRGLSGTTREVFHQRLHEIDARFPRMGTDEFRRKVAVPVNDIIDRFAEIKDTVGALVGGGDVKRT